MTTTQESSGVGVRPPRPEKRLCAETVEGRSQALHPWDLGAQDSPRKPRAMHTGLEPSELGEQDSSGLPRAMHTGQEPPGSTPRPHEKTSLDAETPSEAMHAVVASTDAPIRHPPALALGLQWDIGDTGKATSPPVNQRPSGRRVRGENSLGRKYLPSDENDDAVERARPATQRADEPHGESTATAPEVEREWLTSPPSLSVRRLKTPNRRRARRPQNISERMQTLLVAMSIAVTERKFCPRPWHKAVPADSAVLNPSSPPA